MRRRDFIQTLTALGLGLGARSAVAGQRPTLPILAVPALVSQLADVKSGARLVIHVGRAFLFTHQHVPGARHGGDVTTADGFANLVATLKALPAGKPVTLYCGCCPLDHCGNIAPAERAVREAGREGVTILGLEMNFDRDWVARGYPVERG
jgi:hypothetical protein